jgi:hypothetical protein
LDEKSLRMSGSTQLNRAVVEKEAIAKRLAEKAREFAHKRGELYQGA